MNNMRRTFGSREVRLYEMSCRFFSRAGPCCYDDRRTALQKPARDGLARALRATGDQDAFASEFTRVVRICTRCSHGFLLNLWTVLTVVSGTLVKQQRHCACRGKPMLESLFCCELYRLDAAGLVERLDLLD